MPKISKNKPIQEIEDLMRKRLIMVFQEANTEEIVAKILDDLLTPAEKVMFGKRLLVALFLSKGLSYQEISRLVKVSTATVSTIQNMNRRHGGGFSMLINEMNEKEKGKLNKFLESMVE